MYNSLISTVFETHCTFYVIPFANCHSEPSLPSCRPQWRHLILVASRFVRDILSLLRHVDRSGDISSLLHLVLFETSLFMHLLIAKHTNSCKNNIDEIFRLHCISLRMSLQIAYCTLKNGVTCLFNALRF